MVFEVDGGIGGNGVIASGALDAVHGQSQDGAFGLSAGGQNDGVVAGGAGFRGQSRCGNGDSFRKGVVAGGFGAGFV